MMDANTIDANLLFISMIYKTTNVLWIKEINSEGSDFNFDSQDIYKTHCEAMTNYIFKEKIAINSPSDFRRQTLNALTVYLKENMTLYEKYKDLFNGYNREKLRLDTYRNITKSNLSDNHLNLEIISIIEPMDRFEYKNSSIYSDFGFLSENYHQDIHIYSKKLLNDIEHDFKDYLQYTPNFLRTNKEPFFSWNVIKDLYQLIQGKIFEPILSDYDFFREINFLHTMPKLEIISGQKNSIYFIINELSQTIKNNKRKNEWEDGMLEKFDFDKEVYSKKKSFIGSEQSSDNLRTLSKEIKAIINPIPPK